MRRNARNSGWASIERLSDRTTGAAAGADAGLEGFYRGLPTQPIARRRWRTLVFRRGTLQRIAVAVIEVADLVKPEAHLIDLEIGAEQRGRRHFLDGETEGFRGGIESLVGHTAAALAAAAGKQLRRRGVIEPVTALRLLANLLADAFIRLDVVCHWVLLALGRSKPPAGRLGIVAQARVG